MFEIKTKHIDFSDEKLKDALAQILHRMFVTRYKCLFSISTKNPIGSITIDESVIKPIEKTFKLPFKKLPKKEKAAIISEIVRLLNVLESFQMPE